MISLHRKSKSPRKSYCKYLFLGIVVLFTYLSCGKDVERETIFSTLKYQIPEGFKDSVLVGTYTVYENLESMEGRQLDLSIVVTPALVRDSLMEPIFIIDGGPGAGVSHQAYFYTELDDRYRKYHDIVFVDVRGTGFSDPLHCVEIQTKRTPAEHMAHPFPKHELEDCLSKLQDTVNFNFYQTKYIVEDLEAVRKWLGYEQINLSGISFGGKVSLKYMDKYPESINRVVLHAPDAPNVEHMSRRGRNSEQAMNRLFEFCETDSLCASNYSGIAKKFEIVMERIKSQTINVNVQLEDSVHTVKLNWPPIARKLAGMLYEDYQFATIPYLIEESYKENYIPLVQSLELNNTETQYFFADGMFLSNICAEDIPRAKEVRSEEEKNTFLGDYILQSRIDACAIWPLEAIDRSEYEPISSDIPTLIFSGGFDPVLPPYTGKEIVKYLSNGQHIIIPYMGHILGDLSNVDCYDEYVIAFLENRHKTMDVDCFQSMMPTPFFIKKD